MRPSNAGSGRRPANWQLNIRARKNGFRADSKRANEPESPTTSSSTNTSKNFRSPNTTGYRKRCGKFFWKNAMHNPFRITILDAQKIIGRRNYTFSSKIASRAYAPRNFAMFAMMGKSILHPSPPICVFPPTSQRENGNAFPSDARQNLMYY